MNHIPRLVCRSACFLSLGTLASTLAQEEALEIDAPAAATPPAVAPPVAAPPPPAQRVVNRVAATVNGRAITSSEVRARLAPYARELVTLHPRQGKEFTDALIKAKKAILDELIERELVLSDFDGKGMVMPQQAIDEEINNRILNHFAGNRDLFLKSLRESGLTYKDYRESIRKEVSVGAMRSMRYERNIPPTPDEINAEYQVLKKDLRDISKDSIQYDKIFIPSMVEDGSRTPDDQFALALQLTKDLQAKKTTFSDAAKQFSADMHAEDGGRWPYISRADLAPEFAAIAFDSPEGKVVGPLLDPSGFTILKVVNKRFASSPPLSNKDVKDRVDASVRRKKSEARYRQWVERLRNKAIIRVFI